MKSLPTFLFLICCLSSHAQNFSISTFGGSSNYTGDLQEKNFTYSQSHTAYGFGLLYEITDKFIGRANVTFGKLSGADKNGTKNIFRNLDFSTPITDIHLGIEYNLFNLYERLATPYIFTGISHFSFNPSTKDSFGNKVYLQPLGTEGQGFYKGRQKYKLNQFSFPIGGGIKLALGDKIQLGVEGSLRITFTDYLDDVSTTYVEQSLLASHNGKQAVDFAFRSEELNGSSEGYPPANEVRGNPKVKDWYYFTGFTISYSLGSDYWGRSGGRVGRRSPQIGSRRRVY